MMMTLNDYIKGDLGVMLDHPACLGIADIFQEASENPNTHLRLKKELNERYDEDAEQFKIEFSQCLTVLFIAKDKVVGLENGLDFASSFIVEFDSILVSEESQEEGLITPIFSFIFSVHDSSNQTMRLRACQFLNQCLKKMGDQAFVDQFVYDQIAATMLQRLQDKSHNIRAQAVMALRRIQEPQNPECPIMRAFMFHMENDPSPIVRSVVVKHIAIDIKVIPLLFERIRDNHIDVKKAAFRSIGKAKIQRFSIKQRQEVLEYGMKNKKVKNLVIENVLLPWFQRTNNNYVDFLHLLQVETLDEEITENILFALFEKEPLTNLKDVIKGWQKSDKAIPVGELSCEKVTVWRFLTLFLCSKFGEDFDEDVILEILPNLSPFAAYIEQYFNSCDTITFDTKYIMKQLFEIVSFYSFSDEMGREQIKNLCVRFLVKENEMNFYPNIAKVMRKAVPNVNERFTIMAEAISDIRNPLDEAPNGISNLEENLNLLDCSEEIPNNEELKNDIKTLIKCLSIIVEFMKLPDVRSICPTLATLKNTFVDNCLQSTSPQVLKLAQHIMALYCIWDKNMAQNEFLNYCVLSYNAENGPQALETLFDIVSVHGLNIHDSPPDRPPESSDVYSIDVGSDETLENIQVRQLMGIFISLLSHREPLIRMKVAEGLAKLMLAGHIKSPRVLSHLILLWFNPEYENCKKLRHFLGSFFNILSYRKKGTALIIFNSFLPTLKALNEATDSQPLFQVDQVTVTKLLINLIRTDVVSECVDFDELGSYHYRLALIILEQLQGDIFPFAVLVKSLSFISLDLPDGKFAPILIEKVDSILKTDIFEKSLKKSLVNFKKNLEELKFQHDKINKTTGRNKSKGKQEENIESDDSNAESVPSKKLRSKLRNRKAKNTDDRKRDAISENLQNLSNNPIRSTNNMDVFQLSPENHDVDEPLSPVRISESSDSEKDFVEATPPKSKPKIAHSSTSSRVTRTKDLH